MAADKIPPNGTPPVSNLQNVEMDTEPNRPAVAVENALSEFQAGQEVHLPLQNLNKADQCLATLKNPGTSFEDRHREFDGRSVPCEGFSIREYVAKVRSVDIRKCWPLSESLLDDSLREGRNPPLPPLVRPNYRWWSCQQCLGMSGEHTNFGVSVDGHNSLGTERGKNSQSFDHIVEQQLMVSLDTDLDVAPGISQDEHIRKLCTVQISEQEDSLNIAGSEDAARIIENKSERVDNSLAQEHGRSFIAPSSIKDGHSKIEEPKRISMSDVKAVQVERVHKRVRADKSVVTEAHKKQTQVKNSTLDLMEKEGDLLNDIGNCKKKAKAMGQVKNSTLDLMEKEGDLLNDIGNCKKKAKAMRAPDEATDQARAQSILLESGRSRIDNLNSETSKIEPMRHQNFDIGNIESSGIKICPVCKTFTSATITAVNAHMDNCLAQVSKTEKRQIRMQKQKSRTRKKRSIVDIFSTAPPVQISPEYLDNFQMYEDTNESDCSHDMDANSDLPIDGTPNAAVKESMKTLQTCSETATRDDSSTLKCKRKQPVGAHFFVESGIATDRDGQAESLEMKRRRQRLGIISCALVSKDLKGSLKSAKKSSSTQSNKTIDGVGHHVKDSSKSAKLRGDSSGEQLSNMQLNSEQHCDVARAMSVSKTKNQQQWSGTFREDITPQLTMEQSATMLPEELRALECNVTDIQRGGESAGKLCAKESTGEPFSFPVISDGTGNVSDLSGLGETVPSLNESSLVYTKKPQLLGENECTLQNGGNIGNCKLQEQEESSEQGDQNLLNKRHYKESNKYRESSSTNPGKMGESDVLNATRHEIGTSSKFLEENPLIRPNVSTQHEPGKFRIDFLYQTEEETGQRLYLNHNLGDASNSLCLQSVDRTTANSKGFPSFQNEILTSETRKVREGPMKKTRLNLNQKVCVIARDSKGRFIRSARVNEGKEGELSYSRWKQADRHKPIKRSKHSVKTSATDNKTNSAMNAALSYARIGKSTSMQNYIPVCKDYHGGSKSLSRYKSVPELNGAVARQAAFSSLANTTLNNVEEPLSEKAIDPANFFIQGKCPDFGYIGLPVDSHGELVKHIPNATDGDYDLYKIQNSTAGKDPLVTECSKRLPEFNFVESMDVSNNISEVGRILKMPGDSAPCNSKYPYQKNYSIPGKQADCGQLYSTLKTNQIEPNKAGLVQSSSLDELQREYVENSQIGTFGSSISKTDTSSTLNACMHSTVESGYNGERKQKSSALEKTYPEVQSLRKERPTAQPVMRLMGHNFVIGGENEAGNTVKENQQGSDNETPSISEATLDVSSSNKSNTVQKGHYTACKEGQLYFPYLGPNTLFQHFIRKENISECPQNNCKHMECLETTSFASTTAEDPRRMDISVPKLFEKRFPTNCVPCEQSLRGQFYSEPAWTSTSPFYNPMANTGISPVSHLSSNTGINQGDKMAYKYSCNSITSELGQTECSRSGCNLYGTDIRNTPGHLRNPVRLHQSQVYSQNQFSSLMAHTIPKPVCSGCLHTSTVREGTSNAVSFPIQSDTLQLLQDHSKCNSSLPQWLLNAQKQKEENERTSYNEKQPGAPALSSTEMESTKQLPFVNSRLVPFQGPLHAFTRVLAHPTYFQAASPSHCETQTSSATLTDSAASTMNGRYNLMDLIERGNMKLPKSMSRNVCAIRHEKGNVPDNVDLESPESNCPSDRRTGMRKESLHETNGLHGKWPMQRHADCTQKLSKNYDLFLTGQKSHKRKGVFHHELNSSSLAARHVKNRDISQNDIDGNGAEAWRLNDNSVKFAIADDGQDRRNCSTKNAVNATFSNASMVPQTWRGDGGAFRKPKNNLLENQFGTSRIGLHGSSIEASLKLAEPMKLTGGAKHILKPPFQSGNAKQSLPVHYTLPFAETTEEGRERDLHRANRNSGEQQRSSPGSKLLRWASNNSRLSHILSNGESLLPLRHGI